MNAHLYVCHECGRLHLLAAPPPAFRHTRLLYPTCCEAGSYLTAPDNYLGTVDLRPVGGTWSYATAMRQDRAHARLRSGWYDLADLADWLDPRHYDPDRPNYSPGDLVPWGASYDEAHEWVMRSR